jgi:hypothetical protein
MTRNFAIAKKGRQDFLMSEVLAPGLELLGGFAYILAEPDKCISEAVRIEVRQSSTLEGFPEYRSNGRSATPMGPI